MAAILSPHAAVGSGVSRISINDPRASEIPVLGFRNYWYPVAFLGDLGKPRRFKLVGEEIVVVREADDTVRALQASCPHRGAPLEKGHQFAAGVLTCPYHGFSFDTSSGVCVAALTEGPDSACVGKLRAKTYPAQVYKGLVFVFVGEIDPPPLEEDLPEQMLDPDAVVVGRFSVWKTNWRISVDNGTDAAHVPFLHRRHPYVRWKRMPSFFKVASERKGKWLHLRLQDLGWQAEYPRIGKWPNDMAFRRAMAPTDTSVRLPGLVRIVFPSNYIHLRWSIAIDEHHSTVFQALVRTATGFSKWWFKAFYYFWEKWIYHVSFQDDDQDVLCAIDRLAPERLTQSDAIIVQWRRMAKEARGVASAQADRPSEGMAA